MTRDLLLVILAVAFILGMRFWAVHEASHHTEAAALFIWPQLMKTKIHTNYKDSTYSAEFPEEVKAMEGKPVTISGFMVPLQVTTRSSHFILARRTPTCPFCPPGEPNEVIDVEAQTPMEWTADRIILSGTFELINNAQAGLFFRLKDAQKIN